ncbi:MAG: glycosyltransferase family 39 protein [Candidatus Omnitrophica bacterium]|nr:glycosyltransferase family 39 protein [Candidatus Omnitrophota bacterium]
MKNTYKAKNNRQKPIFGIILTVTFGALSVLTLLSYVNIFHCRMPLGNFQHETGNCYISPIKGNPRLLIYFIKGDKMSNNMRSRAILYEDGKPLGPAHSQHADIRETGEGRYSHWGRHIYISASDNSDPSLNNKKYEISCPLTVPFYVFLAFLVVFFLSLSRQAERAAKILYGFTSLCVDLWRAVIGIAERSQSLIFIIIGVSAVVHAVTLFGTSLMIFPDSGGYVVGGFNIKDSFNFSTLPTMRTPGYPLLLAAIFKIFGSNSAFPLRIIQHGMGVIITVMVYYTALELLRKKWKAFLCAVLSCFSLQLISYANYVMTEVLYAFLLAFTFYFYVRYAVTGRDGYLVLSLFVTGLATNVRPVAQYMIIFPCVSYLIFLFTSQKSNKIRSFFALIAGLALYLACVIPWMAYNHAHNGFFGMTKCVGINLYSRVVEYEKTIDYDSPYIQDIKSAFGKNLAVRIQNGEAEKLKNWAFYDYYFNPEAWKHHLPAIAAYIHAKKVKPTEADDVFLRASLDCIKKYPVPYATTTLTYVYRTLITPEPTYLYIPGIPAGNDYPYPYRIMWDAEKANRDVITNWQCDPIQGYLKFDKEPNVCTMLYAHMVNIYDSWITDNKEEFLFFFLIVGFLASIYYIFRKNNGLAWFSFSGAVAYNVILPMLIVPGTQRMRVPIDPFLIILYMLGLFCVIDICRAIISKVRQLNVRNSRIL